MKEKKPAITEHFADLKDPKKGKGDRRIMLDSLKPFTLASVGMV